MLEILQLSFMRHALTAGLLAGLVCGVIGTFVVVNRLAFLSGGIAHAAYGGIGISLFFGLPFLAGTLGFSVACAWIMAFVFLRYRHRADTFIGVFWAAGMALGIILIDRTPGYHPDLMSFLFGSILAVPPGDLKVMAILGVIVLAVVAVYSRDLLALSYDEEFARLRGVPVTFLTVLLLTLVAVTVVLTIRVVGLILVIALLTIAPFIAERFTRSLPGMMCLAVLFNLCFTTGGLFLAWRFDVTAGAAIILLAATCFFCSLLIPRRLVRPSREAANV